MQDIGKVLMLLGTMFLLLGLLANIMPNFPRIPGDIYINKPGLKIYIPFTSAIVISILLTIFFNFFRK